MLVFAVLYGLSSCGKLRLAFAVAAWASHCSGFPYCGAQTLGHSSFGSWGTWTQQLQLPGSRALAGSIAVAQVYLLQDADLPGWATKEALWLKTLNIYFLLYSFYSLSPHPASPSLVCLFLSLFQLPPLLLKHHTCPDSSSFCWSQFYVCPSICHTCHCARLRSAQNNDTNPSNRRI